MSNIKETGCSYRVEYMSRDKVTNKGRIAKVPFDDYDSAVEFRSELLADHFKNVRLIQIITTEEVIYVPEEAAKRP